MTLPLRGIIPPLVTPLKDSETLDREGLERLIVHLLDHGVHGIFLLGTNGEGPSLGYGLRDELIAHACRIIEGRVPVLVGISDTSLEGSLTVAEAARKHGADAVVVAPPYYFPLNQQEVIDYYRTLARRLPLPFFAYNMPSHTKIHLEVPTVLELRKAGALGIKDSSGDQFYFYSLMEALDGDPSFSLITGTEMFLPDALLYGGHGAVPGGANVFPSLFVRLYEASRTRNLEEIERLRHPVMKIYNTLYAISDQPARITLGIKTALAVMGICDNIMAPPLRKMNDEEREKVKTALRDIEESLLLVTSRS